MRELVFLLSADSDIQTAFNRCEEFQAGRGELLIRHLDLCFEQIRRFPESGPAFVRTYRRMLVPGFPFGIFYSTEGSRIIVAALLDLRQDPTSIRKRLDVQ